MLKKGISIGVLLLLSLAFLSVNAVAGWKKISTEEVKTLVAKSPEKGGYMLVDSRPEIKYFAAHLPWAVSVPWPYMKDMLDELPKNKATKLVFYCGGLKCNLSQKAADLAIDSGYTDVSVYSEGEPGWRQDGESLWVAVNYIKIVLNDPDKMALIVDSRPSLKYNSGTIPGALNIPWPQFEKMKGFLPADKTAELIFFCGGLKCDLSHKSADAAKALGYSGVKVFAEGYPQWKKKSTRAFAMVNPKNPGAAFAAAEKISYPGEIKKEEFEKLVKTMPEGFLLVDVRPAEDFKDGNIPGSIHIIDEEVKNNIDTLKKGKNIVFYCATGSRSSIAYYAAEEAGLKGTRFLNAEVLFNADNSFEVK